MKILFTAIFILFFGILLAKFALDKEEPNKIVPIYIHELEVQINEKVCKFGYCHYSFKNGEKELELKNQRKELNNEKVFLYYAIDTDRTCILRISDEKINPAYLNKLYRERSRYSLQCYFSKENISFFNN